MFRYSFYVYFFLILILTIVPLQGTALSGMNKVYISEFRLDYLLHTALFLPWVFLCEISFPQKFRYKKLIILVAGLCIAVASEYLQLFVAYRAFNINDLLYNAAGVVLGSFVWIFMPFK